MRKINFWESKVKTSPELMEIMKSILESGNLSYRAGGPHVRRLEESMAHLTRRRHAVAVSSATSGLMLLLSHPDFKGREVILPAFTFMATMTAAQWNNMRIILCDVNPETWTIDPEDILNRMTDNTAAIIPVNMFGNEPDYKRLVGISECCDVPLIVDAAQAMGATYDGKPTGSLGRAAVFSFSPSKVVTGCEGGVIVTDDDELYEHCLRGRHYGDDGTYDPRFPGFNAKLTELQAAVIIHQLYHVSDKISRARARSRLYRHYLCNGITFQKENGGSACKEVTVLVHPSSRERISDALHAAGVDHRKYWSVPLNRTQAFRSYSDRNDPVLHVTQGLSSRVLSLPTHDGLDSGDIEFISKIVNENL